MQSIQMTVTFDSESASAVCEAIGDAVANSLSGLLERSLETVIRNPPASAGGRASGVTLTQYDRLDARDLRTAYLLGKLPDNGSLLIDNRQVAVLLNVSTSTVDRLKQEKAMPEPVRIGTRVQWRVREVIEWVEAGCPPQNEWQYPAVQRAPKQEQE